MSDDLARVVEERDLLRREVATLAEQLKLLVKAEHALTRSRREGERQLERINRFADFAFDIAGVEQPDEVLGQARTALLDQFELDEVVVMSVLGTEPTIAAGRTSVTVERGAWEQLRALSGPRVAAPGEPDAQTLLAAARALGVNLSAAVRSVVWVPIRRGEAERVTIALGWTSRSTSNHRDVPRPEHLPFLQLFGNHVTRALDSAHLTTELRRQGAALVQSNQQLQSSLKELEAAQAQLVQAQKLEALGRLAGGIAHDFNNLLTVIVTHAELIKEDVSADAGAREDLGVILDAASRATEITKRLLAFGRKREHHEQNVDLNAATTDLSRMLRRLIGDDIVLQLDLDPGVGRIRADAVHLEQILMNLVVNARDAMPRGGKLTLETRKARDSDRVNTVATPTANLIALSVRDTGIGMDEDTRSQLFEPFFTTKPMGKGTGLGLATVYGLVQQNGGEVKVTSAAGAGSCFTVLLSSAEGLATAAREAPQVSTRGTVLVAEDEDAIRRVLCRVLRRSGFEVVEARDGAEALGAARRLPRVDLLVTDVVMPNMGGPQLVRELRQLKPELPVVFMSGHTFDRLDVDRLDAAKERFLPKPFTPAELDVAVTAVLGAAGGAAPSSALAAEATSHRNASKERSPGEVSPDHVSFSTG